LWLLAAELQVEREDRGSSASLDKLAAARPALSTKRLFARFWPTQRSARGR
jgi:hypothetical protein